MIPRISKIVDPLEGVENSRITDMSEMIIHLRSRKFYDKLNELLEEDVMDKYGPRQIIYQTLRRFDIVLTRNSRKEIILKKVEKIEKKSVNLR